ncbi:efflux RND transporter periplasmic adaptor subunit [Sphingomonas oligophenolica]|uniref:Efflux RND transporter periplasmic adaptor subunit n=1 Tax=Sphingomonas oligophenolica TaxID=301154 RepID=A0A502CGB1_9SPHN|nr:efflux RND transporter periplasmic adaptor subunit [Sphingomonas oligophenolica]TPG12765.1 efflux RND transporter periplasmic adaptor subunit [Sphingomonas oligophenolica]
MTPDRTQKATLGAAIAAIALAAAGGGYYLGTSGGDAKTAADGRKILYYFDPMVPQEHYDSADAKSSMGMAVEPKYADEGGTSAPGVKIPAEAMQNLGARTAIARIGTLESSLDVTGAIDFNQRDVVIVQARAGGFVQRTYGRAPSDIVRAGAPIADLLVPEWGGAQAEYLALRRSGNAGLANAARERLKLLGMPTGTIASVARTGRRQDVVTISTPVGGVIQTLDVRPGMTLAAGQTLAQVNGLGTVWLNAAVPETRAGEIRVGQSAVAELASFPGERFAGKIIAVLPTAEVTSRTLTVRVELRNRGGRLKPGMFATVHLGDVGKPALLIPSEAVIRTGKRTLVMLAGNGGRYQPAEVQIGGSGGGQTEILAGLSAGEKVITSGQFLIDSEASLSGIQVRSLDSAAAPKPAASNQPTRAAP